MISDSNKKSSSIGRNLSHNENAESHRNVKVVNSMPMMGKVVENNPNSLLFGQYSPSTTATKSSSAAKTTSGASSRSCIVCSPNGLTTKALTMNLSSIGCTNIGCIGVTAVCGVGNGSAKDANSNNRMSRSASPALSTAGEINTRLSSLLIGDFSFLNLFLCRFFAYTLGFLNFNHSHSH
jgi:hypothetical protein